MQQVATELFRLSTLNQWCNKTLLHLFPTLRCMQGQGMKSIPCPYRLRKGLVQLIQTKMLYWLVAGCKAGQQASGSLSILICFA